MDLLIEVVELNHILEGVVLLHKVPLSPILLHVSQHGANDGLSLLGSGADGYRNMPSIHPVGILLPPLSPEFSRVFGAVVSPLDHGSGTGSTCGGRCIASLSWS